MACEIVEGAGALFALWGTPTKEDMTHLLERVRAAAERSGGKVVYVTRVPEGAPPPDAKVRRYLNELMPSVVEYCLSYHVVMEGTGFAAALKRGVLLSIFQTTQRRGLCFVHTRCDEVLKCIAADKKAMVQDVLDRAKRQGLLEGNPLAGLAPSAS